METEHFFTCPYCWQTISFVLDVSADEQSYVEDCEVCCRPINVRVTASGGELIDLEAFTTDD
jgi:transcription elongation factor Elf1